MSLICFVKLTLNIRCHVKLVKNDIPGCISSNKNWFSSHNWLQKIFIVDHFIFKWVIDVYKLNLYLCCFLLFTDIDFCGEVVLYSLSFSIWGESNHSTNCFRSALSSKLLYIWLEEVWDEVIYKMALWQTCILGIQRRYIRCIFRHVKCFAGLIEIWLIIGCFGFKLLKFCFHLAYSFKLLSLCLHYLSYSSEYQIHILHVESFI